MASTATITRGIGYWIQDNSFSNNGGLSSGDWKWYIGFYDINHLYAAGCVQYIVPTIYDSLQSRTITVPCTFLLNANAGTAKAVISTTPPTNTSWRYGPTSGVISNIVSFDYSTTSLTFTINSGVDISGKSIYLYIYQDNNGTATYNSIVTNSFSNGILTYEIGGLVYIGNGTGYDAYEVYIGNGISWDKYIPYVGNGTSFDLCN